MISLDAILSTAATTYKKKYPNVARYIEMYYIIDEENDIYSFDFESNDNTESVTSKAGERAAYSNEHNNKNIDWAKAKRKANFNSYKCPSWYEDDNLSYNLEKILLYDEEIVLSIEKWINDRDIYYKDCSHNRFAIKTQAKYPGKQLQIDDSVKEVKDIRIILEYTRSHSDGEFVIYTAYPC